MLQLKKIRKEYKTGDLVQTALNDVSLNLRDSEFVAILGPVSYTHLDVYKRQVSGPALPGGTPAGTDGCVRH